QVINGERRLRAAKIAGLTDLPCIITHDSNKSKLIALVDNIQRADLHPIELADAYNDILEKNEEKDQISLSKKLGVSASKISETVSLYALPDEVKLYLLNNDIRSREFLRKIKKCKDKSEMLNLLSPNKKIRKENSKKNIINVFLFEDNVHVEFKKIKMSDDQKNEFKKELLNIIASI
ncbi:MAG: ParB/RepB/Spo0J family partition protein, partial [Parachlamydiaceae bacterium]|nr:ParB/RepB/Spo0J family partition protein [Parachlamydiaceae bacterium]